MISNQISTKINNLFTLACDHDAGLQCTAKIVAAVVYKNKIISYGFNQKKTHTFQKQYAKNPEALSLHAEVDAIYKALKRIDDLSECSLIISRARKIKGLYQYGLALPCEGCMSCIEDYSIKKVFFTTNNQTIKCLT